MIDPFSSLATGPESPPTRLSSMTSSDADDLPLAGPAINVATEGLADTVSIGGEPASWFISARSAFTLNVRRAWITGTTATSVLALS